MIVSEKSMQVEKLGIACTAGREAYKRAYEGPNKNVMMVVACAVDLLLLLEDFYL